MKSAFISSLFVILLLAGCSTPQSVENHAPNRIIFSSKFLENRVLDFRALVESQNDIDYLAKNHMCLVKLGWLTSSNRAIPIGDGLKLNEVIQLYHGKPYDGQVKVVSRNAIVQTSIEKYDPKEQELIKVFPGDLVFIDARD